MPNEYLHGHTAVVLSNESCANPADGTDDCTLTVELTVHASVALPSAVINTSGCRRAQRVGRGAASAAAAPAPERRTVRRRRHDAGEHLRRRRRCDEHCGWFWLWFPCRCRAAASLLTVPHLLAYKGAGKSYELEVFSTPFVPSLAMYARGGALELTGAFGQISC